MCSLSVSSEAREGPGVNREFRTPEESLPEVNFTSLTSFPPQAWLMRMQISRFMLSSWCCHGFPSAANSKRPLWHRRGRACSARALPTIVGHALESQAIAASGRSIRRIALPRNSPIRSMRAVILTQRGTRQRFGAASTRGQSRDRAHLEDTIRRMLNRDLLISGDARRRHCACDGRRNRSSVWLVLN